MRKRNRYLLIGLGFIVFGILAPSIVFYVRGLKIDTEGKKALETGIITIDSSPDNALVLLNGEKNGTTPENIRFLVPGDYNVVLTKKGYRPWEKRLNVLPGKVTFGSVGVEKLFLFKEPSPNTFIDDGVQNFIQVKNKLIYLGEGSLISTNLDNLSSKELQTIPSAKFDFLVSQNQEYVLLHSNKLMYWYSPANNRLINISALTNNNDDFEILNSGKVLIKSGSNLFILTPGSKNRVKLLDNVKGFGTLGNTIYVIRKTETVNEIVFLETDQEKPEIQHLVDILEDVPSNARIYINNQKFLNLLAGGSLYRLNDSFTKIIDDVVSVNFNPSNSKLLVTTKGELQLIDMANGQTQLISRNTAGFYSNVYKPEIGYVFTASAGEVKAIELDDRDRSNTYLFGTANEQTEIAVDDKNEKLFILNDNKLEQVIIH